VIHRNWGLARVLGDRPLDDGAIMARDLRHQALERLAALAATSPAASFDKSDLDRLCKATPNRQGLASAVNGHNHNAPLPPRPDVGRVPMVTCPVESTPLLPGLGTVG